MQACAWTSPRDGYPDSVYSLMAMWGGFVPPTLNNDNGLEKRLQFDFRVSTISQDSGILSVEDVVNVMQSADQTLERVEPVGSGVEAITLSDSLAILTRSRLLITSSSSVMLHLVLQPMLALFQQRGVEIEWASFLRKNLVSPWGASEDCETGDIMAQEYANLKESFPNGRSFLTGPVDGEHYFHFVFDDVVREEGKEELDKQFNVYLYDVEKCFQEDEDEGPLMKKNRSRQQLQWWTTSLEGGEEEKRYEMQRVFASSRCVSFETNAPTTDFATIRLPGLLSKYSPQRFTLVMFQDRDVEEKELRRAFREVNGFRGVNHTINYFSEGYAFHHVSFERI